MQSTKSVHALHNLFKGYHQPLSLSKQQSEKLLNGIKSSFREQLSREYGPSGDTATTSSKAADQRRQERDPAAAQHFKSILANPLFSYTHPAAPAVRGLETLSERDPMDVFDHALAKGMMNLRAATGCLVAKNRQLIGQSPAAMASSKTATRVIQWLRTSGHDEQLDFISRKSKYNTFLHALMPFVVAEEQEAVVWQWIARLMGDQTLGLKDNARADRASHLLSTLIRVQSQPHHGSLNAAINTILRVEQELKNCPYLPKLLAHSWRSVSWMTTVEAFSRTTPSQELYEAHIATAERLSLSVPVETAHLHLYHPTHPDHRAALNLFNKDSISKLLAPYENDELTIEQSKAPLQVLSWLVLLGHDTIDHLRRIGESREANRIQQLLSSRIHGFWKSPKHPDLLL
jgi:hypothetical protein